MRPLLLALLPLISALAAEAPFSYQPKKSHAAFAFADFLYWTAREEGLAYGRAGILPFTDSFSLAKRRDTQLVGNQWEPAFKAGIGIHLPHDSWDTALTYTRFETNHSSSYASSIAPTWAIGELQQINSAAFNTPPLFGFASANWHLLFQRFDLELIRSVSLSPYLIFRPLIGLIADWQKQSYEVTYSNPLNFSSYNLLHLDMQQNVWGIGIRSGAEMLWYFNDTWGFFGKASIAELWTRFHILRQDHLNTTAQPVYNRTEFHTLKPMMDLQLGVHWDCFSASERYHGGFTLVWETQVWINQNQFQYDYTAGGNNGDLIFQGLTLEARLDF